MSKRLIGFGLVSLAIAMALLLWLRPVLTGELRSATVYAFLLSAQVFYLYNLVFHVAAKSRRLLWAYVAWYVLLFGFFVAVATGPGSQRPLRVPDPPRPDFCPRAAGGLRRC